MDSERSFSVSTDCAASSSLSLEESVSNSDCFAEDELPPGLSGYTGFGVDSLNTHEVESVTVKVEPSGENDDIDIFSGVDGASVLEPSTQLSSVFDDDADAGLSQMLDEFESNNKACERVCEAKFIDDRNRYLSDLGKQKESLEELCQSMRELLECFRKQLQSYEAVCDQSKVVAGNIERVKSAAAAVGSSREAFELSSKERGQMTAYVVNLALESGDSGRRSKIQAIAQEVRTLATVNVNVRNGLAIKVKQAEQIYVRCKGTLASTTQFIRKLECLPLAD